MEIRVTFALVFTFLFGYILYASFWPNTQLSIITTVSFTKTFLAESYVLLQYGLFLCLIWRKLVFSKYYSNKIV
jgi:hypothetical protein